jgi:hypothetical protein
VLNKVSRYRLVIGAWNDARMTPAGAHVLAGWCRSKLAEHSAYIREHFEDLLEISGCTSTRADRRTEWRVSRGTATKDLGHLYPSPPATTFWGEG